MAESTAVRRSISDESFVFFQSLVEAPSPSGFEQPAQRIFREYVGKYADDVTSDVMGNSWGVLKGTDPKAPKVMLAGHCDEVGFIVKHVDSDGFLYVSSVGGHDVAMFPGQRINIHGKNGMVTGAFGRKPVHALEEKDRGKVGKIHEQFVDIGAISREEALSMVALGDVATYDVGLIRLANNRVVSRALDDKVGAFLVAETLRILSEGDRPAATLYGVSTVQEEIGLRGAKTSAYAIEPDVAIAIEVTFAADHPDFDKRQIGECKLASGPVIAKGANINFNVFDLLVSAAENVGVEYQISANGGATGTDANVMQLNKSGCAAGLVSIPLRYMHTPVEIISLYDLESTARVMAEFVRSLSAESNFIPS